MAVVRLEALEGCARGRLTQSGWAVNRTQCKKSPTKWNLPHPCTFSYSLKDLQGIASFSDVVAGDVSFPPAGEKGLVTH